MPWQIILIDQIVKGVFATGLCVTAYRTMRDSPTGLFADTPPSLPDYACPSTGLCVAAKLTV